MDSKIQSKEMDLFFDAILALENKDECYKFFEDIETITELKSFFLCFLVALFLKV